MDKNESAVKKRKRGAQPGNINARKHGFYTREGRRRVEDMDALIRDCQALLKCILEKDVSSLDHLNLGQLKRKETG